MGSASSGFEACVAYAAAHEQDVQEQDIQEQDVQEQE